MAKAMVKSIVIVGGGVVLLIIFACKPWRFFSRSSRTRSIKANDIAYHEVQLSIQSDVSNHCQSSVKVDDLKKPLVSEDLDLVQNQSTEFATNYAQEGTCHPTEGHFSSPQTDGLADKQTLPSTIPHFTRSDSFVLDISEDLEGTFVGQTLKSPLVTNHSTEEQKYGRKEDLSYDSIFGTEDDNLREFVPKYTADQRSSLMLEVISGPSRGLHCSIQSTNSSGLPLTLGRVSPSDLLIKDSEVSGKHAMINWNFNKLKWELVDMGSLNGTLLNSQAIHRPHSESRHRGDPIELASGDIITLGTTSKIFVQIKSQTEQIPFGVGMVSDPMAMRQGGKKLPMEDVYYYQWPLPGTDQFGLFGICDGHGGASAATSASKIMPEMVASILSDSFRRERVLSQCDASDVLREAFSHTEECMNNYYEGCTATVLLVWVDDHERFFAQCANVGDSACVVNIDGKLIKMTEDHRIISSNERLRIQATGEPLKDGETRLCGLNLARMLGDKFLKQQEARFSSEPYISQVLYINQASRGFALLASDGFWDVVNFKKAVKLVHQIKDRNAIDRENSAEKIANFLLSEARTQRTKDNTSIIFLDFDTFSTNFSCKYDP